MSHFEEFMHLPSDCNKFITTVPLDFSHRRYFAIQLRKLFNKYKTNSPYLSQGTFSKLCSIRVLKERDIHRQNRLSKTPISVFVKSDLIEQFFEKHWAREEVKILFTGSSDRNFEKIPNIPKNIEMWFCQNSAISDNRRIFTLPIGLEDISLGRAGRPKFFGNSQIKINKSNKIFVPPMSPTNPIRRPTVLRCTNKKVFDVYLEFMNEKSYFSISSRYAFVLCLEGNGFENHRIWETLYQGGFPVVLRTPWSTSLQYLGLPILYVDSIEELDQDILESFKSKHNLWNPLSSKVLWAPFWGKLAGGDWSDILKMTKTQERE